MNLTQYQDIYVAFLSMVDDDKLASSTDEEINNQLYPLLLSAINDFSRLSEHNLNHRDETNEAFYDVLSTDEIQVLATCMKPKWLERYINSSRKIEQQYYDAGIKTYSPNENLKSLTTLYQQYLADTKRALHEYTLKRVSITGNFGGTNTNGYKPSKIIYNGDNEDPLK